MTTTVTFLGFDSNPNVINTVLASALVRSCAWTVAVLMSPLHAVWVSCLSCLSLGSCCDWAADCNESSDDQWQRLPWAVAGLWGYILGCVPGLFVLDSGSETLYDHCCTETVVVSPPTAYIFFVIIFMFILYLFLIQLPFSLFYSFALNQ